MTEMKTLIMKLRKHIGYFTDGYKRYLPKHFSFIFLPMLLVGIVISEFPSNFVLVLYGLIIFSSCYIAGKNDSIL